MATARRSPMVRVFYKKKVRACVYGATMCYGAVCVWFHCVFVTKSLFFISLHFCPFPEIVISCTSPTSPPKPVQTQPNVDKATFVNEKCCVKYLNILVSCMSSNLSALRVLVMSFSSRRLCSLSGSGLRSFRENCRFLVSNCRILIIFSQLRLPSSSICHSFLAMQRYSQLRNHFFLRFFSSKFRPCLLESVKQ